MSDPGDETPEASGCANDCVRPDHQHGDLFVLAPEAAAKFKIVGPIVRHRGTLAALFADDTADTHDEWRSLNVLGAAKKPAGDVNS